MKNLICIFGISLLILSNSFGQSDNIICQKIDSIVNNICSLKSELKLSKTHEGAEEDNYWFREIFQSSNNEVVLLTINNKNEDGYQLVEYFFNNEQLVFVKETRADLYNKKSVERLYLSNNKMVKWIDSIGKLKEKSSAEYLKCDLELADYAIELKNDFKNPN